jgi:hypothetical protein
MELILITLDLSQSVPNEENCQMVFAMQQEYYLKVGYSNPGLAILQWGMDSTLEHVLLKASQKIIG